MERCDISNTAVLEIAKCRIKPLVAPGLVAVLTMWIWIWKANVAKGRHSDSFHHLQR